MAGRRCCRLRMHPDDVRSACDGARVVVRSAHGFVATELWQYVRRITAPTIYVLGGASTIVPAEAQQRLKETLPNAEIVTMPGLGHYPSSEGAAGFMTIAGRFLKRSP